MTDNASTNSAPNSAPDPSPGDRSRLLPIASLAGIVLALALLAGIAWWEAGPRDQDFRKSPGAILMSALFLMLGVSVVGLVTALFPTINIRADVLFVTILLAPILLYLILSGK